MYYLCSKNKGADPLHSYRAVSCTVTKQLISAFVFAYAKSRFSHKEALTLYLQIGFGSHVEKFRNCQVDGDLLLRITDEDLVDSIKIESTLGRKRYVIMLTHPCNLNYLKPRFTMSSVMRKLSKSSRFLTRSGMNQLYNRRWIEA